MIFLRPLWPFDRVLNIMLCFLCLFDVLSSFCKKDSSVSLIITLLFVNTDAVYLGPLCVLAQMGKGAGSFAPLCAHLIISSTVLAPNLGSDIDHDRFMSNLSELEQ